MSIFALSISVASLIIVIQKGYWFCILGAAIAVLISFWAMWCEIQSIRYRPKR
jgi:hypothetical protein